MPTQTAPSQPQYPCTEMAPQGSSTLSTRSFNKTPTHTSMPSKMPMMTAELALTKAQGAVIATRPASMPLQAIEMSGLPKTKDQKSIAAADPATAARFVFMAIPEMRRSVAPRVEPGLKPIQPKRRMKVPVTTKATLCAGKARGLPSESYLPSRGPRMMASAMAQKPPTAWTTVEPAKSTYPWPKLMLTPNCESHPPPHTQQPKMGYSRPPTKSSQRTKAQNVIRSQMAPTMIYPAVSMKTTSKSVRQLLPTS